MRSTSHPPTKQLVSELLLEAGLVSVENVAAAISIRARTAAPVGATLVEQGVLQRATVNAAVILQALLKKSRLDSALAVQALREVASSQVSIDEALHQLGWQDEHASFWSDFEALLLESELINEPDLFTAIEAALASGSSLTRTLIERGYLEQSSIDSILITLVLVKEGRLTMQQAAAAIAPIIRSKQEAEVWLAQKGLLDAIADRSNIRLGQLLVASELVDELDVLDAVEQCFEKNSQIGGFLVSAGHLSENTLNEALNIQTQINSGQLSSSDAFAILKQHHSQDANNFNVRNREIRAGESGVSQIVRFVGQQEQEKMRLAREMHDGAIADLMMLKRYLNGDRKMTNGQIIEIVDHVLSELRDICNDFAPRHLNDWGLKATLEDLVKRFQMRTGIDVLLDFKEPLPKALETAQLHIFRIIQECLTNTDKYAFATKVEVSIARSTPSTVRIFVGDNGKGFTGEQTDQAKAAGCGAGLEGIQERVEIINEYFPSRLFLSSSPQKGTRIVLDIDVPPQSEDQN